jgi:hypothetical protein
MLLAQPFFVPCEHTYDRIAVYVTVAEAGRVVRLGVYDHAADSVLPKELLLDAGTASIGSTGKKEITISLTLTPGWYWLAITSDTAGTGRLQGSGTLEGLGLLGYDDANTVSHYYFVSRSFNYAALPSLFGGGIAYRDAAPPRIWLRA